MSKLCPLGGDVVIAFALVIDLVADVLAVSSGMSPGTMSIINEEALDSQIIACPLKVAPDATQTGNIVVKVVSTYDDFAGRTQRGQQGRKRARRGTRTFLLAENERCNRQTPLKTVS